ncbi:thymidylate synthase [Blastocystis sp. subtype 4]|jgi:hypothetical protein|uniref:thymidylate synthase n=1 Tax=Blastocystis sp. subtype 4 TaxID=944170 RepID=UPI000712297F|nr:thymidylate synthase [Blastocystis sp. subtype 4]KNB42399.1 thymidylate synthase [Blastocystis sp. subtype 4]|eukprot:XP_014525842.1 thymidylate synthase [Blastocystis sp. subtype 4]
MRVINFLKAKNRDELRQWYAKNHNIAKECWVEVKRGKPTDGEHFWYIDAVEEALCFGWIDSTTKKLSSTVTVQKFMPRSKRSHWTELNKERCRRLERLGRMTEAGRSILPDMSLSSFSIDNDILKALQRDPEVWKTFQGFPDLYRRIRIDTIQSQKKNNELFQKRLQKLVDKTKHGLMYGEWNDYGRLLDN